VKICAQENLSGEVTDQDGKKIGNVYIIIKNKEGEYKTTTNLKGALLFPEFCRLYHIEANAKAYDSYIIK
jgi:iron complex outermembrane receptor protein